MPPYRRPKSQAQRRLMHAAAKDPAVAKSTGVPQSVAQEYAGADKPGALPERASKTDEQRMAGRYGAKKAAAADGEED